MEGGQRTGASPSQCESKPAGRVGLRWRSSGDSGKGRGNGTFSRAAQLPWSSFSGLRGDPEESHADRMVGALLLLFTSLQEDCGSLRPTCAGEFCKLPMALSPVGNYTGHLTNKPAYQVTGAKKIAGLGWGNPILHGFLPSSLPPSDWTSRGWGSLSGPGTQAAGPPARCPEDTLPATCFLLIFLGAQGT